MNMDPAPSPGTRPLHETRVSCATLSFREKWRALKRAQQAVPAYGDSGRFWGSREKINTVYAKADGRHDERTGARLAAMQVPAGARVLDIGAGPGTFAIPLAQNGCSVTAVEPSPVMRELLRTRMSQEKIGTITVIPKRWEDVGPDELGLPYDAVIASFSLTMTDMEAALAKMHASCKGTVHLFWFLTPPAWSVVNRDLWPALHGGSFPGQPTADWLWQILYEMGIYADIRPEPQVSLSRYADVEEAVDEFRQRLNCTTPAHEEIVRTYLHTALCRDGVGFTLGNGTRSAHICWNTVDNPTRGGSGTDTDRR